MAFQLDTGIYSQQKTLSDYMRQGEQDRLAKDQAQLGMEAQKQGMAAQKQAMGINDYKMQQEKTNAALQLLSGVRDEASYQMAKTRAAQDFGIDVSTLPANYDPKWVESTQNQLLTAAERANLDLKRKENEFTLDGSFSGSLGQPTQPSDAPLSVRNNNPANMKDPSTGLFRRFGAANEGIDAAKADLTQKILGKSPVMTQKLGAGYSPTLSNIIGVWAPPSENDTQGYIDFVSKQTGIQPNQALTPADVDRILPSMIKMEGGQQASQYFQQPAQQPQQTQQQQAQTSPNDGLRFINKGGKPYTEGLKAGQQWAINAQGQRVAASIPQANGAVSEDNFKNENTLRDEFNALTEDFRTIKDAYSRMRASVAQPSAAGDLSAIFNYMKILDPGSTVREGEFATAQQATGVPSQVLNIYNRVLSGERLNPEQRADFTNQAKNIYESQRIGYEKTKTNYKGLAQRNKLNVENVIMDSALDEEMPPNIPEGFTTSKSGVPYKVIPQ